MRKYKFLIPSSDTLLTHRASESVYCTTKHC